MNALNMMLFTGQGAPYLVFRVRRAFLIRDTISQTTQHPPEDLRKELKVQFLGEEGIDQGGVQKEFFQLIVRSIFDPAYGMFVTTKENMYWFTSSSQEFADFKLIGTISLLPSHTTSIVTLLLCYFFFFDKRITYSAWHSTME
jgi:ubiquitin-protein ligase E3 A